MHSGPRWWADIPAAKPEVTRQAMGNVVFDLTEGRTLRFSGAYTNAEGRVYRGIDESSYSDYRYWLWDRMVGGSEVEDNNLQLGVRFAQTLSKASFYEVKVNGLWTHREEGPPVLITANDVRVVGELPETERPALPETLPLKRGEIFQEAPYLQAEQMLREVFLRKGYAHIESKRRAEVNVDDRQAS